MLSSDHVHAFLQGVGNCYTDPQIHTVTGNNFGVGNMGASGIKRFFKTHVCNDICRALELTPRGSASNLGSPLQPSLTRREQQRTPPELAPEVCLLLLLSQRSPRSLCLLARLLQVEAGVREPGVNAEMRASDFKLCPGLQGPVVLERSQKGASGKSPKIDAPGTRKSFGKVNVTPT